MRKNLNTKIIVILATIAICVFGIVGVPHGVTPAALKNAITSRINLGLDLRGGTHLVLQVHVEVIVDRLRDRFGVEVTLKPPRVPYRETIRSSATAHGRHKNVHAASLL